MEEQVQRPHDRKISVAGKEWMKGESKEMTFEGHEGGGVNVCILAFYSTCKEDPLDNVKQ